MKLSRNGCALSSSISVDCLWICSVGLSGFRRARIPLPVVGVAARVGYDVRICARSSLLRAQKPMRKCAHNDLTNVR